MTYLPRKVSPPPVRRAPEEMQVRIAEVDFSEMETFRRLNTAVFDEERIINSFDRPDLMMLLAYVDGEAVGFKIGYRENRFSFYSAKGGVLPPYRRRGLARRMLYDMMERVTDQGFARFAFDTFPNRDPGMTILALNEGFRLVRADFNSLYKDYRLRFEKKLA